MKRAIVEQAHFIYEVTAEENNRGRVTVLTTCDQFKAAKLEKEINAGKFAGCYQAAATNTFIFL